MKGLAVLAGPAGVVGLALLSLLLVLGLSWELLTRPAPRLQQGSLRRVGADAPEENFSVTLVTQSSPERLWLMRETCVRWTGPIVLVVFERSEEALSTGAHLLIPMPDGSTAAVGEDVCPQAHVIQYFPGDYGEDPMTSSFPVNRLRNIGIDAVKTSHFFYLDIDFWPASDLEQRVNAYAAANSPYAPLFAQDHTAVVVPAFNMMPLERGGCQFANSCRQSYQRQAPKKMRDLRECLHLQQCQIFDVSRNPGGHSSTNTPFWLRMTDPAASPTSPPDLLYKIPCFQSVKYEPYVLLKRSAVLPRFDERFSGYGKNKIEFVEHLRFLNFSFVVLPELFVVHLPHEKSKSFEKWLQEDRERVDALFDKFLLDLSLENEGRYDTPMCPTDFDTEGAT
eukprot:INCI10413.1.p1 GENE.INCI10413.1~~INCI10413.1.p1  ORF type:complete len:394 (-),score=47.78 INCI10413.1:125-1306(-)